MSQHERFKVQTAAEFVKSGPAFGSRAEKLAIEAEESAKRTRERQRRERLARMTRKEIARERAEFEQCENIAQIKRRLTGIQTELDNKERFPIWLQ